MTMWVGECSGMNEMGNVYCISVFGSVGDEGEPCSSLSSSRRGVEPRGGNCEIPSGREDKLAREGTLATEPVEIEGCGCIKLGLALGITNPPGPRKGLL